VPDFSSDQWHLAGSVKRGLGRSWLVTNHGLDDRWGEGPWNQAASSRAPAIRWLREELDKELGARVPVRLEVGRNGLTFVYVDRRYLPADDERAEGERAGDDFA
jgi:hypothetical protein